MKKETITQNTIDSREGRAKKRLWTAGALIGTFLGGLIIAYALSLYFTSSSFIINNTKGHIFSIDLSGAVEGIEVVPGSEQGVAPTMTNTGTEPMYVFIRFDTATYYSGSTGQEEPVYSFNLDE